MSEGVETIQYIEKPYLDLLVKEANRVAELRCQGEPTAQPIYHLDSSPKQLSNDSSWEETLGELNQIKKELSALKNGEVAPNEETCHS